MHDWRIDIVRALWVGSIEVPEGARVLLLLFLSMVVVYYEYWLRSVGGLWLGRGRRGWVMAAGRSSGVGLGWVVGLFLYPLKNEDCSVGEEGGGGDES
jgi:hypothetical protein